MDAYELAVADALTGRGWDVFVPHKDRGVDLVVLPSLKETSAVRIQVKGSRTYSDKFQGWYRFDRARVSEGTNITDFWVFVCLVPSKKGIFHPQFVVLPPAELASRIEQYQKQAKARIDFYLTEFDLAGERHLIDDRGLTRSKVRAGRVAIGPDHPRNYSRFWSSRVKDVWSQLPATRQEP